MAIMLFSSPVELSTGPLGVSLAKRLPGWRWQCGESFGPGDEKLPLDRKLARLIFPGEVVETAE